MLDGEAARREPAQVAGATGHVEDALAARALEVMVVLRFGDLVARRIAGQCDQTNPALRGEPLQVAIDRGEPELVHARARRAQDVLR